MSQKAPEKSDEPKSLDVQLSSPNDTLGHSPRSEQNQKDTESLEESSSSAKKGNFQELSPEELKKLASQLPPLPPIPETTFSVREQSPLPPKSVTEIEETFPPVGKEKLNPPTLPGEPLKLLRVSPVGEVGVVPFVSATFNRPVVPIADIAQLAEKPVPVTITPKPPGKWKWVGTQTTLYTPDAKQFPMATSYTIAFQPAEGTKGTPKTYSFTTPTVTAELSFPRGTSSFSSPILLTFNQKIDPNELFPFIEVTAEGSPIPVKQITPDSQAISSILHAKERRRANQLKQLLSSIKANQYILLQPEKNYPSDSKITVTIKKGAPSAEGPLKTTENQSYTFHTHPGFEIKEGNCSYEDCPPESPLAVRFSTSIDEESFEPSLISVTPPIEDLSFDIYRNTIVINGIKKPETKYTITVEPKLKDIFGQSLEGKNKVSVQVGKTLPYLSDTHNTFTLFNPYQKPIYHVKSAGIRRLRFLVWKANPKDYQSFANNQEAYFNAFVEPDNPQNKDLPKIAPPDLDQSFDIEDNGLPHTTSLDLSPLLKDKKFGNLIVLVYAPEEIKKHDNYYDSPSHLSWVNITDIGVDVLSDNEQTYVWVNQLKDGKPIENASVQIDSTSVTTDANGIAILPNDKVFSPPTLNNYTLPSVIVTKENDTALYPNLYRIGILKGGLHWVVVDDRTFYRPGETVTVKGWIREINLTKEGGVTFPSGPELKLGDTISWEARGSRDNLLAKGNAIISQYGTFNLQFTLPKTPNLGRATILFTPPPKRRSTTSPDNQPDERADATYYHSFEIAEFRTPEYEVTIKDNRKVHLAKEETTLTATASYYAGGRLADAPTTWNVDIADGTYTPPGNESYTFGNQPLWWWTIPTPNKNTHHIFKGETNAFGEHLLNIRIGEQKNVKVVTAKVAIQDLNRQTWQSSTSYLSHASEFYVGLKTDNYFTEINQLFNVRFVVPKIDGTRVAGKPVSIVAERVNVNYAFGKEKETRDERQECDKISTTNEETCAFTFAKPGRYEIIATVKGSDGRENVTTITRWVNGNEPLTTTLKKDEITLIPDKELYQPGDTARILIQSPYPTAEGLYSISRNGIIEDKIFRMDKNSYVVEVPIKEAYIPNLYLNVKLLSSKKGEKTATSGSAPQTTTEQPAYATKTLKLNISRQSKTLQLEITPFPDQLAPREVSHVKVNVRNAKGEPSSNTQVALFVVDEAILALSHTPIPNLVEQFYPERPDGIESYSNRSILQITTPQNQPILYPNMAAMDKSLLRSAKGPSGRAMMAPAAMEMQAEAAPSGGGAGNTNIFIVRDDFNPLAKFVASDITDSNGEVTIDVKLPDNLTRYRVLAFATAKETQEFGSATSSLTARLPLMVRPSAPRFLHFNDQFKLPILLQNQTDQAMNVNLIARSNRISFTEEDKEVQTTGKAITIPANNRVEIELNAKANEVGEATLQVAVEENLPTDANRKPAQDASTTTLSILTPATSETFATYQVIDKGSISQPIAKPKDVWPQFGNLTISTSSTALAELTDAIFYLYDYNYQWSTGIASAALGILATKDFLRAFNVPNLPSAEEISTYINKSISTLLERQATNGGFYPWPGARNNDPMTSLIVIQFLVEAKNAGYKIPDESYQRAISYAKQIRTLTLGEKYSPQAIDYLEAFALYIRKEAGEDVGRSAEKLYESIITLTDAYPTTLAWLLDTLPGESSTMGGSGRPAERIDNLLNYLQNRIVDTAKAATITTKIEKQDNYLLYRTNTQMNAFLLDALIAKAPKADYIPKLVNGLLKERTRGRWNTISENAFILRALKHYFEKYERQVPSFTASAWLGKDFAGEEHFSGRKTVVKTIRVPMATLLQMKPKEKNSDSEPLIISKQGKGRLYLRVGLDYAPKNMALAPLAQGFEVTRSYTGVDHKEDVIQKEDAWYIKAGSRVRVDVTVAATSPRHQVALIDPFPAGFEVLNAQLAVADSPEEGITPPMGSYVPPAAGLTKWIPWFYTPWSYTNLRRDRAEAYATELDTGVYTYSYYVRATTPGRFHVPPAKALELFAPETFGRSGSGVVVVE